MSTTTAKPAYMPWISPYLMVQDVEKALNFYQKTFNFKLTDEISRDDTGRIMHAAMQYHESLFMLGDETKCTGTTKLASPKSTGHRSPIGLYVYCDNVDKLYEHALKNGAQSEMKPEDMFWGDRMCAVVDPDGYVWSFATHTGKEFGK